jgi:hypothetical protein
MESFNDTHIGIPRYLYALDGGRVGRAMEPVSVIFVFTRHFGKQDERDTSASTVQLVALFSIPMQGPNPTTNVLTFHTCTCAPTMLGLPSQISSAKSIDPMILTPRGMPNGRFNRYWEFAACTAS